MTKIKKTPPPAARTYSTFLKAPPKAGYAPGDVLKLGKNQVARYQKDPDKGGPGKGGYYAAPKVAVKPTVQVVRPGPYSQEQGHQEKTLRPAESRA